MFCFLSILCVKCCSAYQLQLVECKYFYVLCNVQAIESDAEKITTGVPRSKVVVKMLKDDASKDEQLLFFEEVAPFRSDIS